MIRLTEDIHSMTAFKRDIAGFLDRLRASGRPMVLTKNGKADFVVLTAAEFERLWELSEQMEDLRAIRQGLDEADAGKGIPLKEAFDEIRNRHGVRSPHRATGSRGD